ncbi:hypothetical protein B0H14DRAFT_3148182 [Mycena olivaceomarginata]|nr:hypothetical protein B0H14DRAFT_3148182 [Mycena olivaceomarginata]
MFVTSPLILLLAASFASARIPATCTHYHLPEGNAVSPLSGYGLTPPAKFCGYILSIGLLNEGLERIPVLLLREQSSVLLDLLQLLSHRTASWLQSKGYPETVTKIIMGDSMHWPEYITVNHAECQLY